MKYLFLLAYLLLFPFSWSVAQTQTVNYTESTDDFVNPDRGFYYPIYTTTEAVLDSNTLKGYRNTAFTPFRGNYQVRVSLIFRYYVLDQFRSSAISQTFLNNMEADFVALRAAGMRVIPRFTYNIDPDTSCGDAACPPYLDAPKSRILSHIAQIKPLLQANSDVISAVQLGFIGVWGESYYTDYFGTAASNRDGKISDANWQQREEVLAAMLDAVPDNRMVQVRYPQIKQKYVYGIDAPVSSAPLTLNEAHDGTDKARIGFHNDCFLASPDDFGTYFDYGSDDTNPSNQINILKPYFADDSRFVAVGGETCSDDSFDPENNCASNGGIAVSEMEDLNYSYLNSDYNNAVNNDWQDGNCMDDIKRRLGYRFVLNNGTYPNQATAGTTINLNMNFKNIGFTAPFNERLLRLVFKNTTSGASYSCDINGVNTDTRFWQPSNNIQLNGSVEVPLDMPAGNYDLLLHIADPSDQGRILNRPEYSIRLANQNMWDNQTGFNDLNHTISVSNANCTSTTITIDGNYSDWTSIASLSTNGSNGLTNFKAYDDETTLYWYANGNLATHYQLFLDSDPSNGSLNKYDTFVWSNSTYNYMIENGLVYQYTGSGSNWSWSFVGSAMQVKSGNNLELSIDKSLLNNLAGNIGLGFAVLDNTWTVVGQIPNANTGTNYELSNSTGCSVCATGNLALSGNISTVRAYATNASINSTQTIRSIANVAYTAQNSITLEEGFEVTNGGRFSASIQACTASIASKETIAQRANVETITSPQTPNLHIAPNPFDEVFQITLEVKQANRYSIIVYDLLGRVVEQVATQQFFEVGSHSFSVSSNVDVLLVQLQGPDVDFSVQKIVLSNK